MELTQEEFNSLFTDRPQVTRTDAGTPLCPYCGTPLGPQALDYWNQSTEAGTDCCEIEITCQSCGRIIWRGGSWWPWIASKEELLNVAEEVLDDLATFGTTSAP